VEEDLEGLGVGCHNDYLRDATVEGFGGLVGTFLELFVLCCLCVVERGVRREKRVERRRKESNPCPVVKEAVFVRSN
jgi:hypothetical protein